MAESAGYTNRFDLGKLKSTSNWASDVADEVIRQHPDEPLYTCAAGISPSGVVHFGNFRDIVTAHLVRNALVEKGKNARLIFSWDNFDRFRKVPSGVPESYVEHIGKPLSKIPDFCGEHASYAEHFQAPFVEAMAKLGIDIEYRNQTELHESGAYDAAIREALDRRLEIADILLSFMTDKAKGEKGIDPAAYRETYYPIAVYSRFTGTDITKVQKVEGTNVTYLCVDTKQTETVDIAHEHIAKLAWKIDWPMRWRHEKVHFEPGGHDHASPGGSYDVASTVAHDIYEYAAPIFVEYKFVGIQGLGAKMSGSKGNAVSPLELLDIYEPELLKWLYSRKSPDQSFELAFNTEIYRQYDEFDAERGAADAIPFRQAVSFGQIVGWQADKLGAILDALALSYSKESIERRLPLARNWLVKYNPDEVIALRTQADTQYANSLDSEQKARIERLRSALESAGDTVAELETLVYDIPKEAGIEEAELKRVQRAFFKDVYMLLIGRDTGPRLGTFLWASDRKQILKLLSV